MESGISYRADKTFDRKGLLELYEDVGWTAYTDEPERLERAIAQSAHVVSAWDGDRLVGLARVVSDGEHIVFAQDVLVLRAYRRRGLGRELLRRVLEPFQHVRQTVLVADNAPELRAFYAGLGFEMASRIGMSAFMRLKPRRSSP